MPLDRPTHSRFFRNCGHCRGSGTVADQTRPHGRRNGHPPTSRWCIHPPIRSSLPWRLASLGVLAASRVDGWTLPLALDSANLDDIRVMARWRSSGAVSACWRVRRDHNNKASWDPSSTRLAQESGVSSRRLANEGRTPASGFK